MSSLENFLRINKYNLRFSDCQLSLRDIVCETIMNPVNGLDDVTKLNVGVTLFEIIDHNVALSTVPCSYRIALYRCLSYILANYNIYEPLLPETSVFQIAVDNNLVCTHVDAIELLDMPLCEVVEDFNSFDEIMRAPEIDVVISQSFVPDALESQCNPFMLDPPMRILYERKLAAVSLFKNKMTGREMRDAVPFMKLDRFEEDYSTILYDRGMLSFHFSYPFFRSGYDIMSIFDYYIERYGKGACGFWNHIFDFMTDFRDIRRLMGINKSSFSAFLCVCSQKRDSWLLTAALSVFHDEAEYDDEIEINVEEYLSVFETDSTNIHLLYGHTASCNKIPGCYVHNLMRCSHCERDLPFFPLLFTSFMQSRVKHLFTAIFAIFPRIFSCYEHPLKFNGRAYADFSILAVVFLQSIHAKYGSVWRKDVYVRSSSELVGTFSHLQRCLNALMSLTDGWFVAAVSLLPEFYYRYYEKKSTVIEIINPLKARKRDIAFGPRRCRTIVPKMSRYLIRTDRYDFLTHMYTVVDFFNVFYQMNDSNITVRGGEYVQHVHGYRGFGIFNNDLEWMLEG